MVLEQSILFYEVPHAFEVLHPLEMGVIIVARHPRHFDFCSLLSSCLSSNCEFCQLVDCCVFLSPLTGFIEHSNVH
jgi:hypothetical protein